MAGETGVPGENPPQRRVVHHKSHMQSLGIESKPSRGPNVSILHLRSTSEPWETPSTTTLSNVTRSTSHTNASPTPQTKFNGQTRNTTYASLPSSARHRGDSAAQATALFIASSTASVDRGSIINNGTCSRELSPVRWCDREVDGVYLGRSGWVQVQQRSLDENRRANYGILTSTLPSTASIVPTVVTSNTLPNKRPSIRLADYHCSNSEPGKFPDPIIRAEEQHRPAFLPLPLDIMKDSDFEHRVNSKSASPSPHDSSRDIIEDDMMSPPSVTPIISPPPAFQDPNRQVYGTVRRSNGSSKPHFLSRSNAIVDSPPSSPLHIPTTNWSTLPSPRSLAAAAAAVSSSSYFKISHKVSPITTPTQQPLNHSRIPQTKSLEDKTTSSVRRSQFQRYDSSSSSSSSFGFRSLDSNINTRTAMPRLSETDSSIGGYEDGDEEEIITPSKTVPPSLKDVISLSPDTPTGQGGQIKERSSLVHGDKISPSSLRHANRFNHQRAHPPRRSPGSEGSSGKKKNSNHSTSSTSSSSSSSLSSCGAGTGSRVVTSASMAQSQAFRRSVSHSLAKQQSNTRNILETIPHGYHTWDGRNRVRRSRSLQLPETKSPGALSPSSFSNTEYQHLAKQQHQPQHHYPQQQTEPHRVTVKIGGSEQPQERPRRPFIQHRKAQSEDNRYQDGFLRWEDEARAVTDYLHGTRSRAAARALLQAHYHSTTDHGSSELQDGGHEQQPSGFNIIVVSSRGNKVKTQSQRQQRILQRGITTPTTPGTGTSFDINPCTPNTCDFWPHCAHRDSLYPPVTNSSLHNKPSSLSPGSSSGSKLPSVQPATTSSMGSAIRLSQTYPSTTKASSSVQRGRSSDSKHIYDSDIKASKITEGSVEGHNVYNPSLSDHKNSYQYMHSNRSKNGPNENVGSSLEKRLVTTPENEEKKFKSKSIGRQQHYSHCQTQKHSGNYNSSSEKLKSNVINKASSVINYPTDSEKCDQYKGDPASAFGIGSGLVFSQQDSGICGKSATSPIMDIQEIENSLSKDSKLSPSGGANTARSPASSASSSSSDVWVTTSDRTVTKSPRMAQRSSGTSTPQDDALSMGGLGGKSPLQERDKSVLEPRPGSAPAAEPEDVRYKGSTPLDSQQRSLSLPKSFLSERASPAAFTPAEIIIAPKQSHVFSWKPRERETPAANKRMKSPSTEVPLTARISVRDPSITGQETSHYQPPTVMSKSIRHNKDVVNIPADDPVASRSDWDIRRPWSNASSDNEPIPAASCRQTEGAYTNQRLAGNKDLSQSQHNLSGPASESVLQKFRKNFVMKFHKKGSKSDAESTEDKTDNKALDEVDTVQTQDETTESSALLPQQGKDEANVNAKFKFGPLVWRSSKSCRKGKKFNANDMVASSKIEVHNEVTSEQTDIKNECNSDVRQVDVRNEESIKEHKDKLPFQVDLSNRPQNHHHHVRRTNSDFSGQRLLSWDLRNNYRRMFSTPSPIKMRPSHATDSPQNDSLQIRKSKQISRRPHLRRSISQPLGLNDLSPLMCQRTGTIIMGQRKVNMSSEDEHDIPAGVSDDEIMSDSESSITSSLADRKKSFEQGLDDTVVAWAEAVWDHVAMEPEELAFRAGDVIEVVDAHDKDWWWGSRGPVSGWFPAAFVRLRVSQENTVEDCLAAMASGATSHIQLRQRTSVSLLSNDEVRSRVVRELISTERDFVKILTDVVEGYLKECRKRTEMFSPQHINRIFGNLEELLEFQSAFVNDLENYVDKDAPHKSCIGECFLSHKEGFQIYSEYCNSHPMAIATLQELYERENYSRFFEACRLMRGLMEIPLDGYLLTPVQRICKYPLQLAELLKYTKTDHPDYSTLQEALDTMRNVAILINERKRRMESLEKLAAWQQRVEAWEGEDLIETSTQLIHQGEVTKMTTGMWTSNVTLFLFDHQLIYCKKDIIKRNTYVYKGRIQLDTSEVIDVPDGKDPQLGVMMKQGLKVYCYVRDKWLLFCCRTIEEKQAWLDALTEERKLVAKDQLEGLELPPAARQLARMAARCQRRPPNKPRGKSYKRSRTYRNRTQNVSQHNISGSQSSSHSLARIGMWFNFGSNKKGRPVI